MFCTNSTRWLYRSEANFSWQSGINIAKDLVFLDSSGKVRLIIETDGLITITRGYAWNGCSPKFCLLDLLVGTPDGAVYKPTGRPKTYYASMVHDALYQFLNADSPVVQHQADRCFLRLMAESRFRLRYIYWLAVYVFGSFVWHGKKAKRQWAGERVFVDELMP